MPRAVNGYKVCSKCKERKLVAEFSQRSLSPDGLHDWCKACNKAYQEGRREVNKLRNAENGSQTEGFKVCCTCGECKPVLEFTRDNGTSDGLSPRCRECRKTCRKAHREKNLIYAADFGLRRKYDISLVEYDEMLNAQGENCAICGKTPEEEGRRLAVDHNHKTAKVRGLLCLMCNRYVGHIEGDPALHELAVQYLRSHE